ncbi:hypothetical protein [Syntrophomonas erecta]
MNRYYVTEKSWHSEVWIWFALLLIAGFFIWRVFSPLAAMPVALLGILLLLFIKYKGQKKVGDLIEINDKGMTFSRGGEQSCIAFNEIKSIKESRNLPVGPNYYIIQTGNGNKCKLQPDEYENGMELRDKLQHNFEKNNCVFR